LLLTFPEFFRVVFALHYIDPIGQNTTSAHATGGVSVLSAAAAAAVACSASCCSAAAGGYTATVCAGEIRGEQGRRYTQSNIHIYILFPSQL